MTARPDTCPACSRDDALVVDGPRLKCLYCGHEKLAEARAVAPPVGASDAKPVDAALAAVTGEKLPDAPKAEPRVAADLASRRRLGPEGHVRAIAGWLFVLALACAAAAAVYPRLPDDLKRHPWLQNPAHVYSRLGGAAVLFGATALGLAGFHAWARWFVSLACGGLFCFSMWMLFDASRLRMVAWALFAFVQIAVLIALHTGASDTIFTKHYRLLVRESRDVRAHTKRSPYFWMPLLILAALAAALRYTDLPFKIT